MKGILDILSVGKSGGQNKITHLYIRYTNTHTHKHTDIKIMTNHKTLTERDIKIEIEE